MGNDSEKKEDSGFGFKDKAKALETIKLLEKEPSSYQTLTVRGLLGRAKRTLKLTKDAEKIKNISQAIEVFEKWTDERKKTGGSDSKKKSSPKKDSSSDDEKDSKSEKKEKEKEDNSAETVPGLGFKDKEKALETIRLLEGRDPDYQKLAVKGLVGRAKRVLTCTKDKEKLKNINDAIEAFDDFLERFDKANMSKQNMSYLPLPVVEGCLRLAKRRNVTLGRAEAFVDAYRAVDGQYKRLRTVEAREAKTWDVVRNDELRALTNSLGDPDLFDDDENPTDEHLQLIVWAYSPQEHRTKKLKFASPESGSDVEMEEKSSNGEKKPNERKRKGSSDESANKKKK